MKNPLIISDIQRTFCHFQRLKAFGEIQQETNILINIFFVSLKENETWPRVHLGNEFSFDVFAFLFRSLRRLQNISQPHSFQKFHFSELLVQTRLHQRPPKFLRGSNKTLLRRALRNFGGKKGGNLEHFLDWVDAHSLHPRLRHEKHPGHLGLRHLKGG